MEFNVADLLEAVADLVPDREAVICGRERLTYRALDERASQAAHALATLGVTHGSHVGLYGYNSIEWVELMLACYKLRAVPINVNYRYVEKELHYLFDNADITVAAIDSEFLPRLNAIRATLPLLAHVVVMDGQEQRDGALPYRRWRDNFPATRDFPPRSGNDEYVCYTGGTTGMPKGVIWRHHDVIMTLGGGIDFMTREPFPSPEAMVAQAAKAPQRRLVLAPLMHGAAQWQVLGALFGGHTCILYEPHSFDADLAWELVCREQCDNLTVTGDAMARPLADALASGKYDARCVTILSSSAAVFSAPIKDQFLTYIPHLMILDSIGATETGFTGLNLHTKGGKAKDSGGGPRVMPAKDTLVLDTETLQPLPPGTGKVGTIARSGNVPVGYYKDPKKTAATFRVIDGVRYAIPGDFARLEEDGTITLLGRGSVSINSGGEKIYPEEVEQALKAHPDILDALVVGLPDERFGQRVTAVIRLREGHAPPTLEDVQQRCREYIAGYKIPRTLVFSPHIERSPSGKPDYQWAKRYAEAQLA